MKSSQELIDALADAGFQASSHSGRGMDGRICVSVKNASAWAIAYGLGRVRPNAEVVSHPYIDQLGRNSVLYWPHYEWPKGLEFELDQEPNEDDETLLPK